MQSGAQEQSNDYFLAERKKGEKEGVSGKDGRVDLRARRKKEGREGRREMGATAGRSTKP